MTRRNSQQTGLRMGNHLPRLVWVGRERDPDKQNVGSSCGFDVEEQRKILFNERNNRDHRQGE